MGAVQSDLKASIVQASSGGRAISPGDDEYWSIYWLRPETAEHVFETFTSTDIRAMRDDPTTNENLKVLILKSTLQLINLRHTAPSLSDENSRNGLIILNCVRLLTRVFPYIYEAESTREWEETIFSNNHEAAFYEKYRAGSCAYMKTDVALIAQLVNTLLELLFYPGFTLVSHERGSEESRRAQPSYGLWQSGIACDTTIITSKELESRRTELLRLLLTLESKSVYLAPHEYIDHDVQALRYIVRHHDKRRVQSLLCSLLNTIIKYHPDSWLPFDPRAPQGDDARATHVKTCLHFLLVTFLNRAPWDESGKERNEFRLQFSYLHKPKHFQFLADGIFKILRRPLEGSGNMLSLTQRSVGWGPEMIVLAWEALYTNHKYMQYLIDSGRALDLMVLLIFYARESQMEGVGRVCVFCLQTLSAEPRFGELLNRPFDAHDTLPINIQIKNFHGRYADYFITSILTLMESSAAENNFWLSSLTTIVRNVTPFVVGLGRATSSKLMQMFARYSKPSFVLANDGNVDALANLLGAINAIIESYEPGHENDAVLYATWRARDRFRGLRQISLMDEDAISSLEMPRSSRSSFDDVAPTEKSRGKQPSDGREVNIEFMNKIADLPLHTPLTLISLLESGQSTSLDEGNSTSTRDQGKETPARGSPVDRRLSTDQTMATLLGPIRGLGSIPGIERSATTIEAFRFQPSIAALYASYYWGLIVSHDALRASGSGTGVWAGTEVRLFKVKAGQVQGPSLWSPRGAVDAVGESLVAGVKDLTLRARKGISGE